jgi:hypothetical protein
MLKGKQKKLDKNNNGRIDAEDFKLLQGSKKGMRMNENGRCGWLRCCEKIRHGSSR